MLELWEIQNTPTLLSPPGPLRLGMLAHESMYGFYRIRQFTYDKLNGLK